MYILRINNTVKIVCAIFCAYLVIRPYKRVLFILVQLGPSLRHAMLHPESVALRD